MPLDPVFVGMDLGAFKTSIVSSNGRREFMPTAVGWAKDVVARAMLGRDVVFGEDVLTQRRAVQAIRPFEKGMLKYLDSRLSEAKLERHRDAAKLLVQHVVSLTQPPTGARLYGVIGAPSRASVNNKQEILDAAADAFSATMIVPEPFAVAYGMNCLSDTIVVDIGAGTTDICPMYGAYPTEEDQVTVPLGGDALDEKIAELVKQANPDVQVTRNMAREIKEKHGFVHEPHERIIVRLPVQGHPRPVDITDPLRNACLAIAREIATGLRDVIVRIDPEFQRAMLDNILLAGGGSQLRGLDRFLERSLDDFGGGYVRRVYDSVYAGAAGALKLAMNIPVRQWEETLEAAKLHVAA